MKKLFPSGDPCQEGILFERELPYSIINDCLESLFFLEQQTYAKKIKVFQVENLAKNLLKLIDKEFNVNILLDLKLLYN